MTDKSRRLVLLLGREGGLDLLRRCLSRPEKYDIRLVLTHRWLPFSESRDRAERPEFTKYSTACESAGVPLKTIDDRASAENMASLFSGIYFDYLVSLSWRYRVPKDILDLASRAAVNLHRGKLPRFAGATPVFKALKAGEKKVTLTAHHMIEEIDSGEVIVERKISAQVVAREELSLAAERIKRELVPHYFEIMENAFEKIEMNAYR